MQFNDQVIYFIIDFFHWYGRFQKYCKTLIFFQHSFMDKEMATGKVKWLAQGCKGGKWQTRTRVCDWTYSVNFSVLLPTMTFTALTCDKCLLPEDVQLVKANHCSYKDQFCQVNDCFILSLGWLVQRGSWFQITRSFPFIYFKILTSGFAAHISFLFSWLSFFGRGCFFSCPITLHFFLVSGFYLIP